MDRLRLGTLGLAALLGAGLLWYAHERSPAARLARASALAFERRPAEAAAVYESVIASLDPAGDRDAWADAHVRLAQLRQLELGDPRGAAEIYRRLIAQAPDAEPSWVARERLADLARHELHDPGEAMAQWRALALSGRPGADRFAYRIARAHFAAGAYEEAREASRALADRSPGGKWTDDALLLRASAFEIEGRYAEAITAFEDVERRYPGSETAARARYQIGQAQAASRDWEAAQASLLQALETHPDPWRVQADLARVRRHLAELRKMRPLDRAEALAR